MKYLIPNGTSSKNIGDLAILTALVDLIRKADRDAHIILHSTDSKLHKIYGIERVEETLYSYVAFAKRDVVSRIVRLMKLFFYFLLFKANMSASLNLITNELGRIFKDYQAADVIIFSGGGYLRTRYGITQSLNLLMQLFMMQVATTLGRKSLVAPISFGPFAYLWQEKLAASLLRRFVLVSVREEISYQKLLHLGLNKTHLSSDLAFLHPKQKVINKRNILGFTIRNWFKDATNQSQLETVYFKALEKMADKYKFTVQPIVQVAASDFAREDDVPATKRLYESLKSKHIKVNKPKYISDVYDALETYGKLKLLLGMRMHSVILAVTQHVPFVTVGYEHKTAGIAKILEMSDYYLGVENLSFELLYRLLESAYKNRGQIENTLKTVQTKIKRQTFSDWKNILKNL